MATIHISQAEAESGLSGLLSQLDQNTSFVIENAVGPIAVLQAIPPRSLSFAERLALLPSGSGAVMDEDFARDVQEGIDLHRKPLDVTIFEG